MILEVAIPTFNRAVLLQEQLKRLFEFRKGLPVKVTVFDNGSTDSTAQVASAYTDQENFRYQRAARNCGISRNIIRCFEETDGDWVWTLSDDNPVRENDLAAIIGRIQSGNADIWTFKTLGNSVVSNTVCHTTKEFLTCQTLLDLGFLTATVYSRQAINAGLGVLAQGSYSLLPHCLLAIAAVRHGMRQGFSAEELCEQTDGEKRISRKEFALGAISTLEFFNEPSIRTRHARTLRGQTRWMLISALAQCESDDDLKDWRRVCEITNHTLAVSGAGLFRGLLSASTHTSSDKRREIIIQILKYCPVTILRALAKRLAKRTNQSKALTISDNAA